MRNPCNRFMGTSKNSEFAHMQGVGKTSQRSITSKQPLGGRFLATKWNG